MIVLGRVSAPYGIQGWVKVHVFGSDPLALTGLQQWWLGDDPDSSESWQAAAVRDSREQGGTLLALLEGVADRTAALGLKGKYIGAPREVLPPPAQDEFYWGDLVGLAVFNESGEKLGEVSGLIESATHDVLVVRDDQRGVERLMPFVAAVIRRVDMVGRTIRVAWGADW
jgi:16S rRNA processing protein RimM